MCEEETLSFTDFHPGRVVLVQDSSSYSSYIFTDKDSAWRKIDIFRGAPREFHLYLHWMELKIVVRLYDPDVHNFYILKKQINQFWNKRLIWK